MRTLAVVLVVVGVAAPAAAQVLPQPQTEVAFTNLTAIRVNPLGLVNLAELTFRARLYEAEPDALKQNFFGIGLAPGLSPAWARFGVIAEVQPLTILKLWGSFEAIRTFGTFDLMASFPSPREDFSDSDIDDRSDQAGTESYSTQGTQWNLGANLQLKLGPIAVRDMFRAFRPEHELRDGDRVYYDQLFDVLAPNGGWVIVNDADVLYVTDRLAAGIRYTYVEPIYQREHDAPGDPPEGRPDNLVHRLGILAAYSLVKNPGARLDTANAVLLAQWHLMHRWRTGEDVTGALPFIALALQLRGNLLAE